MWRIWWVVMTVFGVGVALYLSRYLSLNPDVYFAQQRQVYVEKQFWITLHVLGGILALGLGPFQFIDRWRLKTPGIHRWIGRVYLVSVLIGSIGGFRMALVAHGGFPASLGFAFLAVLWFATALMAYIRIRQRNIEIHRRWMIRNYALTFAAVTLRIFLPIFIIFFLKGDFTPAYIAVAWWCWVPNLLVAEIAVNRLTQLSERSHPVMPAVHNP